MSLIPWSAVPLVIQYQRLLAYEEEIEEQIMYSTVVQQPN